MLKKVTLISLLGFSALTFAVPVIDNNGNKFDIQQNTVVEMAKDSSTWVALKAPKPLFIPNNCYNPLELVINNNTLYISSNSCRYGTSTPTTTGPEMYTILYVNDNGQINPLSFENEYNDALIYSIDEVTSKDNIISLTGTLAGVHSPTESLNATYNTGSGAWGWNILK